MIQTTLYEADCGTRKIYATLTFLDDQHFLTMKRYGWAGAFYS